MRTANKRTDPPPFPGCTYSVNGCGDPIRCASCGFDRKEAKRRRALPLVQIREGIYGKRIGGGTT